MLCGKIGISAAHEKINGDKFINGEIFRIKAICLEMKGDLAILFMDREVLKIVVKSPFGYT